MRAVLLSLALLAIVTVAAPTRMHAFSDSRISASTSASTVQQTPQPQRDIKLDVNVNRSSEGAWYRSPVWIAIGILAVIVILLLIVLVARSGGGGTTIVER